MVWWYEKTICWHIYSNQSAKLIHNCLDQIQFFICILVVFPQTPMLNTYLQKFHSFVLFIGSILDTIWKEEQQFSLTLFVPILWQQFSCLMQTAPGFCHLTYLYQKHCTCLTESQTIGNTCREIRQVMMEQTAKVVYIMRYIEEFWFVLKEKKIDKTWILFGNNHFR